MKNKRERPSQQKTLELIRKALHRHGICKDMGFTLAVWQGRGEPITWEVLSNGNHLASYKALDLLDAFINGLRKGRG